MGWGYWLMSFIASAVSSRIASGSTLRNLLPSRPRLPPPLGGDQTIGSVVLAGREEVGVPELCFSGGWQELVVAAQYLRGGAARGPACTRAQHGDRGLAVAVPRQAHRSPVDLLGQRRGSDGRSRRSITRLGCLSETVASVVSRVPADQLRRPPTAFRRPMSVARFHHLDSGRTR